MKTKFSVNSVEYLIQRFPLQKYEKFQAWNASDEYIINHIINQEYHLQNKKILIFNDTFGALSCALNSYSLTIVSDSFLSIEAIKKNLLTNKISNEKIIIQNSLEPIDSNFDLAIIHIPKKLKYLEFQLQKIRENLSQGTIVIACDMAKNIHKSTIALFEYYLGETKTSLAWKKSRLIFSKISNKEKKAQNTYPSEYSLKDTSFTIVNYPNVFSQNKLDIGTRFFLENFPVVSQFKKIIDLGCGNGVLGLIAASKNSEAEIICTDESFMAIQSAKETFKKNGFQDRGIFKIGNSLSNFLSASADLILCNPPFHQNHTISTKTAKIMFSDSYRVLKKNGEIWIIANRHLLYHLVIKQIFQNIKVVASNKKFVILKAKKTK